jgi:hypothetical protein
MKSSILGLLLILGAASAHADATSETFSDENVAQPQVTYDVDELSSQSNEAAAAWAWQCTARDLVRTGYRYTAWDYYQAENGALYLCQRNSPIGGCRLLRCDQIWTRDYPQPNPPPRNPWPRNPRRPPRHP